MASYNYSGTKPMRQDFFFCKFIAIYNSVLGFHLIIDLLLQYFVRKMVKKDNTMKISIYIILT